MEDDFLSDIDLTGRTNIYNSARSAANTRFKDAIQGKSYDSAERRSLAERLTKRKAALDTRKSAGIGSTAIAGNPYSFDVSPVVNGIVKLVLAPGNKKRTEAIAESAASIDQMDRDKADIDQARAQYNQELSAVDQTQLKDSINDIEQEEQRAYNDVQQSEQRVYQESRDKAQYDKKVDLLGKQHNYRMQELKAQTNIKDANNEERFYLGKFDEIGRQVQRMNEEIGTKMDGVKTSDDRMGQIESTREQYNFLNAQIDKYISNGLNPGAAARRSFEDWQAKQNGNGSQDPHGSADHLLGPDN